MATKAGQRRPKAECKKQQQNTVRPAARPLYAMPLCPILPLPTPGYLFLESITSSVLGRPSSPPSARQPMEPRMNCLLKSVEQESRQLKASPMPLGKHATQPKHEKKNNLQLFDFSPSFGDLISRCSSRRCLCVPVLLSFPWNKKEDKPETIFAGRMSNLSGYKTCTHGANIVFPLPWLER